jgi:uncharacterized delta-60 repeat protein
MMDSTGALVSSFNGTGMVTVPGQSVENPVLALDSNGRILLAVSTSAGTIQVSRYLQNGSADASFGFNSSFVFNNSSTSVATSLGFQSDQKIIVGGYSGTSTTNDFLVFRLDTTGTLDLNFNTTGFKTQPLASSVTAEEANGMGIMGDDRILLAGTIIFSSAFNEDVGMVMLKCEPVSTTGITESTIGSIKVYPNPIYHKGFWIDLLLSKAGTVRTEITDAYGRLVYVQENTLSSGEQRIGFEGVSLSIGFYCVSVKMGDGLIGLYKICYTEAD